MTAAEILRNAEPPADDGLIDKAIAELDVRIWEWADALKSAHTQLRGAFASKPARPSARLFEDTTPALSSLSAAAAAAHIPSPPPMPAEWTASPAAAGATTPGMPAEAPWATPSHGGHGMSAQPSGQQAAPAWPEPHSFRQQNSMPQTSMSPPSGGKSGVMEWPSTGGSGSTGGGASSGAGAWPTTTAPAAGVQEWPTWTPTDVSTTATATQSTSAKKSPLQGGAPGKKLGKQSKPVPEGPTPEERAQKAAAEEALLAELEEAIARRVRLLRRLDPDTPIEKLIDKARQGQAESAAAPQAREDKSSSWWRRK
jgi:hypothetical protein